MCCCRVSTTRASQPRLMSTCNARCSCESKLFEFRISCSRYRWRCSSVCRERERVINIVGRAHWFLWQLFKAQFAKNLSEARKVWKIASFAWETLRIDRRPCTKSSRAQTRSNSSSTRQEWQQVQARSKNYEKATHARGAHTKIRRQRQIKSKRFKRQRQAISRSSAHSSLSCRLSSDRRVSGASSPNKSKRALSVRLPPT